MIYPAAAGREAQGIRFFTHTDLFVIWHLTQIIWIEFALMCMSAWYWLTDWTATQESSIFWVSLWVGTLPFSSSVNQYCLQHSASDRSCQIPSEHCEINRELLIHKWMNKWIFFRMLTWAKHDNSPLIQLHWMFFHMAWNNSSHPRRKL